MTNSGNPFSVPFLNYEYNMDIRQFRNVTLSIQPYILHLTFEFVGAKESRILYYNGNDIFGELERR